MKKTRSVLSLLLAVVLTLMLSVPALAAGEPKLDVTADASGVRLTVSGLASDCQGLQFTMRLDRAASEVDLTFSAALDEPGIRAAKSASGTELTVYIASKSAALGEGGSLDLGALSALAAGSTLTSAAVSSVSGWKLLRSGDFTEETFGPSPSTPPVNPPDWWPGPGSDESSGGSTAPAPTRYRVEAASGITGGKIQLSASQAAAGDQVTVTALPDTGYVVDRVTASGGGRDLVLTDLGGNRYSFAMPNANVTVQALFAVLPEDKPVQPQPPAAELPFVDVAPDAWYREAVEYVYRMGLMNGMSATAFVPNGTTTRAQIVTILHRLEGTPAASGAGFTDVPAGQWYAPAINWAASNAIVDGYGGGKFGPDDQITREQMAAILYRYAQYKGYSTSALGDLSLFSDGDQVSGWARGPMVWANGSGLINGKSGGILDPQGHATRAEAAAILMRFCENLAR